MKGHHVVRPNESQTTTDLNRPLPGPTAPFVGTDNPSGDGVTDKSFVVVVRIYLYGRHDHGDPQSMHSSTPDSTTIHASLQHGTRKPRDILWENNMHMSEGAHRTRSFDRPEPSSC
jgi:hypothetical protein